MSMDKIIYSKYSNDRSIAFQIRTDIVQDNSGNKRVVKRPLTKQAVSHIRHIYDAYVRLSEKYGSYVKMNQCVLTEDTAEFEFLNGKTLNEEINFLYEQGEEKEVLELIKRYAEFVSYGKDDACFYVTEEFKEVFGEIELPCGLACTSVADIDLIFENILIENDNWNIIDFEWTFFFPVPVNFIIYRGIAAFAEGLYVRDNKKVSNVNLYEFCGITKEEIDAYKLMIDNFEKYVMNGGYTMKRLHGMISQKIYHPMTAINFLDKQLGKLSIQVFYDCGNGYDERDSYFSVPNENDFENLELSIQIKEKCSAVRIDPAINACIVEIKSILVDGETWEDYLTNGFSVASNVVLYEHDDPQIYINHLEGKHNLRLSAHVIIVNEYSAKNIITIINQRDNIIKERNTMLQVQNVTIDQQKQVIQNQNTTINQQEQVIQDQNTVINQQEQVIQNQNNTLNQQEQIIKDLWAGIDDLNNAIHAIENSPSWKITAPLRKTKALIKKIVKRTNNNVMPVVEADSIQETTVQNETLDAGDCITETEIVNPKDAYVEYVMNIPDTGLQQQEYVNVSEKDDIKLTEDDVKYVAFYLPQYHSFPENDAWWGKNFTEWTNVTKTVPLFTGHYQPRLAGDLGYYRLDDKNTIKEQMNLAKKYGIYGFCIYYYWFDGKKLMNTPLNLIMENKDLNLPFCVCWANENWSRRWDGKESDILIAQNYNDSFAEKFIADVSEYMKDSRYIRMGGKPVLIIYNANEIPNLKETLNIWRAYCKENGIGEIHISAVDFALNEISKEAGFDDYVEFPPHSVYHYDKKELSGELDIMNPEYQGVVYDYQEIVKKKEYIKRAQRNLIPGVFLAWDNTARKKNASTVYHNYSPIAFGEWLSDVSAYEMSVRPQGERFVFINAWNEWAEGTYLEPDRKYGYAALETVRNTISKLRKKKKIIYVSHDACFNGAQMLSLNIIKVLKEVYGYDVYLILKGTGVLKDEFYENAYEAICLEDEKWSDEQLIKWIYATGADTAICNTVVTGDLVKVLAETNIYTISLIHEMENVIRENHAEEYLAMIAQYAQKVIFASDYVRKSCDHVYKMPSKKTLIMPQGIYTLNPYLTRKEEIRHQVFSKYGIEEDQKLIIGVGFGDYRKGVDLFIQTAMECIKLCNNVTFMWVGDLSPDMEAVRGELLNGKDYEKKIKFVGKQIDPMIYYTSADVFLLTSREDPFPTVVMEAMYSYLPVIAFQGGGGYVEIVTQQTGKLVDMGDTRQMAEAVFGYINDPDILKKTGKYAHDFVAETFKFAAYVGNLLVLLGHKVPTVSVVIPNYNYARYLEERINTVLQQDYPIKEILILDDCSTDNSIEIIDAYAKKYPDIIQKHVNKENAGNVFKQWNKGFELAKGDFVWIAEADDLSDPAFLRRVMGLINTDSDIVMCYSQSKMIDENGKIIGENYFCYTDDVDSEGWKRDYVSDAHAELVEHMVVKNTIPNVSGVVFKNADYSEIMRAAMGYTVAGDWRVYADILLQGGKIGFVSDSLNYHRRHANSVTTDLKAEKHYQEVVEMQNYMMEMLDLTSDERVEKYREFLKEYFGLKTNNSKEIYDEYKGKYN